MRKGIPISIAKYDAFDLIYFDPNYVIVLPFIGKAYLALELCENHLHGGIRCYFNGEGQDAPYCAESSFSSKGCGTEILLDVSEIFLPLALGIKENKGFIIEYGQNSIYAYQLFIEYSESIIEPIATADHFYEDSFYICSNSYFAVTPFILISNSSTNTFVVENMGRESISLAIENSPNACKTFDDAQGIQILPMELGLITPIYFTKYARLHITSGQTGVFVRVWYQSQQVK